MSIGITGFFGFNKVEEGLDPDAQAFLTATGITDTTMKNAINTLVIGLKADALWTKMKVIYPVVGGTSTTHKYNLKDPRDLDAAYRITFNGTWTHNSDGMVCDNSISNYAITHLFPNELDRFSNHISIYSSLNKTNVNGYAVGIINPNFVLGIRQYGGDGFIEFFSNQDGVPYVQPNQSDVRGLNIGSRLSNEQLSIFRQKVRIVNATAGVSTSVPSSTLKITLNGLNSSSGIQFPDNCQFSFISMGDGLTQTDVNNLYDLLDVYQTTLGRVGTPTPGTFPT